eukprot:CAMPEP_0113322534 /NCGR_PEP_ID=MMETSP0010_2-20120614/15673_1 /TAXON_ID=216773 ORGANISM="Corethron hystrix, Strain 308" /NCGR_SAMPLE_ID=MMETSP0010_2 /ASSEMBLY_ACC=CAM_ASM_000155 /LENGTH=135 /DNA_ID=CAMNT_0000181073 /DNA_START=24 /DNA_END=429 /DNA_ORIENTATION=- /assembly_acc=CAM_ASM_000155
MSPILIGAVSTGHIGKQDGGASTRAQAVCALPQRRKLEEKEPEDPMEEGLPATVPYFGEPACCLLRWCDVEGLIRPSCCEGGSPSELMLLVRPKSSVPAQHLYQPKAAAKASALLATPLGTAPILSLSCPACPSK